MSDNKTSIEINNRTLSLEINKIGKQADGSAFLRYGDTIMFATATSKKEMKEKKPFRLPPQPPRKK
jgi:polyribonucleotide nucleotidyltransferase